MPPTPEADPAATRGESRARLQFIDAARGSAMFFVLLSHFAFNYFSAHDATGNLMTQVGMVASPTFMLINGMLLGMYYRTRPADFERFRTIVTDRGLFLLTIGHLLILLSHATYAVRFVSITDAVGVCMLISPWLLTTVPARVRLLLALGTYAIALTVALCWHPTEHYPTVIKETFFGVIGRQGSSFYVYAFPILPWYSLELAATALGERLGALSSDGDVRGMHRLLLRTAVTGAVAAAGLNLAYHVARSFGYGTGLAAHAVGSPFAKMPPSLVYLMFYGSLGLVLISASLHLASQARMARVVRGLSMIGQTSFVVFVIQFFVYFTVLPVVRPYLPLAWAWPFYFGVSIAATLLPALVWQRGGYNRLLTVGYRRLVQDAGRQALPGSQMPASLIH
jgi:Heparan-alpha-glucosaminide N-acetyltransferase, catalytic